jgi:hypothetical protein
MDWNSKDEIMNLLAMMRSTISKASQTTTISTQQTASLKVPTIKGNVWVAKFSLPSPPEEQTRQLLLAVIDKYIDQHVPYSRPLSTQIDLEWTGFRPGAGKDTPQPRIPELEKYHGLIRDTTRQGVVMLLYGGAF